MESSLSSTKTHRVNLTNKLTALHELVLALLQIDPNPYLIKAEAQIEAALSLRYINFAIMLSIAGALDTYKMIAPYGIYKNAFQLCAEAEEILYDLPVPYIVKEEPND